MHLEGFITYLKKQRRSQSTIENCIKCTLEFETYLQEYRDMKDFESAIPGDLDAFILRIKEEGRSPNSCLWGIGRYYEFVGNNEMRKFASEWRQRLIAEGRGKRKGLHLREIEGVDPNQIQKLANVGIEDVMALLEAGRTKWDREKLASTSGISLKDMLMLVKLADLTRIVDIKGVRVSYCTKPGLIP
ncbi:MAG: hypothetical protein A2Z14_12570 [Chloroflexi bacterium RBG_16_48_8]|nr:MAG: hypothetical protein A2Z14_12570 [Chloroflexi bacterium RBG_16_48_8]